MTKRKEGRGLSDAKGGNVVTMLMPLPSILSNNEIQ
jgi:hypothetical protein